MEGPHSLSVFAHPTDRGAFIAYFLGAIVPLVALGVVIERYVLSPVVSPAEAQLVFGPAAVLALFAAISLLSLGSFLLLRKLVRAAIDRIQALAHFDSLTGLPNRRLFLERLDLALTQARREEKLVATCFLDLDRFKRVNDTLGHSAGDELLSQVAERLVGVLRLGDSLARGNDKLQVGISRLGGDEFSFLLTGLSDAHDAGRVASRVIRAMRAPFMIDGREIVAAGSIGVAVSPLDGDDAETLLKNADTAMYSAKDCGGGVYRFYSRSMNQQAERKVELEARLRRALERDQLTLHYQPLWDAVGGTVRAAEALLRWHDPEIGDISPAEFVPVAEDAGLITEIGAWVLRTACVQAQRWQAAGYAPIRMGVNVSGHQLRQPEFVGTVTRVLEESGLSADYLELEITESTMMQYDEVTTSVAEALSDLGVGLSLDDFGTGYSSLSYLRQFPIRRVKIDRSFVAQIPSNADDMAITAAIVAMAHNLLLSVVGEGVETEEQAQSLRDLGCQELQGFLLSPAVPAEDFTRFLRREKDE